MVLEDQEAAESEAGASEAEPKTVGGKAAGSGAAEAPVGEDGASSVKEGGVEHGAGGEEFGEGQGGKKGTLESPEGAGVEARESKAWTVTIENLDKVQVRSADVARVLCVRCCCCCCCFCFSFCLLFCLFFPDWTRRATSLALAITLPE